MLSYFYWDPNPALFEFNLPFLGRPILWYGFLFALGFLLGYRILLYFLKRYPLSLPVKVVSEKIAFYTFVGALSGARIGDVLFYQSWKGDLSSVYKFWEGGLASHGGAAGILIALALLAKRLKELSFLRLLDFVVIPAALAGSLIRIGNFMNQEILGTVTALPWAVLFGHPADGGIPMPRHPVQLYESLFYLLTFVALFFYAKKNIQRCPAGKITGLFMMAVFAFRFFIEFLKEEQSAWLDGSHIVTMGQYLSLPLIASGCYLVFKKCRTGDLNFHIHR